MKPAGLAVFLCCATLAACIPPTHSGDYSVPFAKSYWETAPASRPALSSLSIEQLYALNQYGRRAFHPWRTMGPAFGCRGPAAIPFLKSKISPATVGSLLELFRWMRDMGTYRAAADPDLMSRVRAAYNEMPRDLREAYASELHDLEAEHAPSSTQLAPERLRAIYCADLDSVLVPR